MTDLTPFVMNDPGVSLLQNATDASLLVGAQTRTDTGPGFWSFLSIFEYFVSKFAIDNITGLADALTAKQSTASKGQAGGYASLDNDGKVPADQLPIDFADLNTIKLNTYDNATPADGQLWFDGTDLKFRLGGATKTVTLA